MVSLKHKFESAKADGTDSTEVRPSDWNAEHDLILEGAGVLGKEDAGSGPAVLIPFSGLGLLPTGSLLPFAGSVAPTGFLLSFGQVLARVDYPALFGVIGTAFNTGGETTAQFRLPDLRGVVIAGLDNMGGPSANRLYPTMNSGVMGSIGGAQNHALTIAELANHDHDVNDPSHAHPIPQGGLTGNNSGLGGTGGGASLWSSGAAATGTNGAYTGISVGPRGGSQPHINVQPTIVMNWMIKT